jgi:hypothetical protein
LGRFEGMAGSSRKLLERRGLCAVAKAVLHAVSGAGFVGKARVHLQLEAIVGVLSICGNREVELVETCRRARWSGRPVSARGRAAAITE